MTVFSRRGFAIGLCVLILIETHSPLSALASDSVTATSVVAVPSPAAPNPEPVQASLPVSASSSGSTSVSYKLLPDKFAVEISPSRLAISQTDLDKVQTFQVVNRGQSAAAVTVQKRNFKAAVNGSLVYQANAPYAASEWITVQPAAFVVRPGQTQVVTAKVKVPGNPEVGDHQVALVFLVPAGKTQANIKIDRGIATPIFITVPGPQDNSVELAGVSAPHFATGGPVTMTARIQNTGTVHRDFRGASPLRVDGAGSAEPFPDFTVLRGAMRDVATTWTPPFVCICHPSVTIVNADGKSQTLTIQVIVFPLRLLLLVLGSGLILLLLVLLFRRQRRNTELRKARHWSEPVLGGTT